MAVAAQRIGISGSVLLLVAAFMPVWAASQRGTSVHVSLFEAMRYLPLARDELGVAGPDMESAILGSTVSFVAVVAVALAGYVMALLGARRLLLVPALLAAVVAGGLFAYSLIEVGRLNDELGGAMDSRVHLSWGWIMHLLAVLSLLTAAIMGFFAPRAASASAAAGGDTVFSGGGRDRAMPGPPPRHEAGAEDEDGWRAAGGPRGWMLSGKTPRGRRIRLRLEDDDLGRGVVLGRGPTKADILIDDESVSRAHLRVALGRGVLVFEDLGSTNGTSIDGHALTPGDPAEAPSGAEIRIGDVRFMLSHR